MLWTFIPGGGRDGGGFTGMMTWYSSAEKKREQIESNRFLTKNQPKHTYLKEKIRCEVNAKTDVSARILQVDRWLVLKLSDHLNVCFSGSI